MNLNGTLLTLCLAVFGLAQKNEAKLMQEGAAAYFEKSKLGHADLLIDLVKKTLDQVPAV